ncbi:SRPBCC family protein [Methyloprofundus sedimenti]|uniref:hypothetical protein n=1 Tax=Methyloprofundus sedimenti TaxID=1420851 RepID=UPI0011806E5D|nr:hypothetical protein [Methyloprofundus sedimenti]
MSPLAQVNAQENSHNWQLVKDENDIKVYLRNLSYSDYKEFRGKMMLNTRIEELLSFINNASFCPAWRYKCIQMLNLSDGYIYKLSSLPWPLNNRYTVMQSKLQFDKKNNIYTLHLKNIQRKQLPKHIQAQLPEQENTVQMRYSDGFWQFKLNDSSGIDITYQMHGDPAGAIPSTLANQGITNAAFVTLSNLKNHFSARQ